MKDSKFTDISWLFAEQDIKDLFVMGVVNGKDETHYEPNAPVTRGEIAIIARNVIRYITGKWFSVLEKIKNLIDLKSILTILIAVTLVAIIFAHINIEDESIKTLFISIASAVFTSYFQKDNKGNAANTEANK